MRVLAELGRQTGARAGDLASWQRAVATLSGLGEGRIVDGYLAEVYGTLRRGGEFEARGGERVRIDAHPDVAMPAPSGVRETQAGRIAVRVAKPLRRPRTTLAMFENAGTMLKRVEAT